MLIGMIALPCILMATAFFLAIRRAYHSHSPKRPLFLYPLICSFVMTSGCMAWGYYSVCTSKSSTAALGLFSIPFYSPVIAVAGLLVSWSVVYVARFVVQRIRGLPVKLTSVIVFALAIALLVLTGYSVQNRVARHRLMNEAASGRNADSLETILVSGTLSRDWEVLSNLAENRNTPQNDLARLYDFCKPNVTTFSPPEYPVFHALAHNPRTPPDILAVLAGCRDSSTRLAVATNPSTPTRTLHQLAEGQDDLVRGCAKREQLSRENGGKSPQE
jgi:hypothetical protein